MTTIPEVTRASQSKRRQKPDGTVVRYYLFPEYEVHYNELPADTIQQWHHHESIEEAIFVISGELTLCWQHEDKVHEVEILCGDVARLGSAPHTLRNRSDQPATFVVFKIVLDGVDKSKVFGNDKYIDRPPT